MGNKPLTAAQIEARQASQRKMDQLFQRHRDQARKFRPLNPEGDQDRVAQVKRIMQTHRPDFKEP